MNINFCVNIKQNSIETLKENREEPVCIRLQDGYLKKQVFIPVFLNLSCGIHQCFPLFFVYWFALICPPMDNLFSEENQIVTIVIIGVLLLLLMAVALLLFFFFSRKKIVEKELENKELEISHQKEVIHAIILTQEKERKRIAQDLHDDISSKLTVINLNSNFLLDGELSPEEYTKVNKNILKVTNKALASARKIAHDLMPPILEKFGLQSAIEELVDEYNTSKKVAIESDIAYPENHLTKTQELHVFRVVQELMSNSIRHGKAKEINISFQKKSDDLTIEYKDNGVGFSEEIINQKKGLGMKNIESRIELLNGELTIKSAIKKGIYVSIIF